MCGIIGYLGPKKTLDVLIQGLEKLEYRGYDSSGVSIYTDKGVQRIRSKGTLLHLKEKLKDHPETDSSFGIGHTRWATHGAPSDLNAHPHKSGSIHLVHNGIIENDKELRQEFKKEYTSQTDTEVLAHILDHHYSNHKSLLKSLYETLLLIKGYYSFVALSEKQDNHIVGVRNGPPLIIGYAEEGEFFISSDLPSLLQWTHNICILEQGEVFSIEGGKCTFYDTEKNIIKKNIETIKWDEQKKEKQGHPHFMLKEILEQPLSIAASLNNSFDFQKNISLLNLDQHTDFNSIINCAPSLKIIACGSSYYAAVYAKFAIESLARIPVEVDLSSEFQYRDPILTKNTPLLFISQSGETADTLSCLHKAKKAGAFCISLCNVKNSSIDRESHLQLYIHAGMEYGVASTKTFTSTLCVLLTLALDLAHRVRLKKINPIPNMIHLDEQRAFDQKEDQHIKEHLMRLPQDIERTLLCIDEIQSSIKMLKQFKGFLFLGRGPHYPIAMEGALKMKELIYLHAEGYPSGEMKHGPLALVDSKFLVIGLIPKDKYYKKNLMNLEEAKTREGSVLTIGHKDDVSLKDLSIKHLCIPQTHPLISPIIETLPLQILSYSLAVSLGHNVDQPRNLAKSVTVE